MRALRYDPGYEPPAPVVPVRVTAPRTERAALLAGLIDTGADCTLVPERVARALGLPRVDTIEIAGVTGAARRAAVHVAGLSVLGVDGFFRVVALGEETILGRDVLNRIRIELDGPRGLVRPGARRGRLVP